MSRLMILFAAATGFAIGMTLLADKDKTKTGTGNKAGQNEPLPANVIPLRPR